MTIRATGAKAVPYSAAPLLAIELEVAASPPGPVHAVALQCQVRIEPQNRQYDAAAKADLKDLFGEPHRWGQTLKSLLWTHAGVVVPRFAGRTTADLPVPCSFDFTVAATKYFAALADGEVPLRLLFSGSVFYEAEDGGLRVAPIPWSAEQAFRLPVRVWKETMDHYYPNAAWLSLHRDVFEQLYRYKVAHGLPTWERTIERLLDGGAS